MQQLALPDFAQTPAESLGGLISLSSTPAKESCLRFPIKPTFPRASQVPGPEGSSVEGISRPTPTSLRYPLGPFFPSSQGFFRQPPPASADLPPSANPSPSILQEVQQALTREVDGEAGERFRRLIRCGSQWLKEQKDRSPSHAPLPLSALGLGQLLAGELPRGGTLEMIGRGSSGRFSAVLAALADTTATGQAAGLIDLGDALEPARAQDAGVDLERLLWLRPRSIKEALKAAEALLTAGFALVVVDLGLPPLPGGRGSEGSWRRLARAARQRGVTLLVAAPYRSTGTAAEIVVTLRRRRALWRSTRQALSNLGSQHLAPRPALLYGLEGALQLRKHRSHRAGRRSMMQWLTADCPNPALPSVRNDQLTVAPAPSSEPGKLFLLPSQSSPQSSPRPSPRFPSSRSQYPPLRSAHGSRGGWRRQRLPSPPSSSAPPRAATA